MAGVHMASCHHITEFRHTAKGPLLDDKYAWDAASSRPSSSSLNPHLSHTFITLYKIYIARLVGCIPVIR